MFCHALHGRHITLSLVSHSPWQLKKIFLTPFPLYNEYYFSKFWFMPAYIQGFETLIKIHQQNIAQCTHTQVTEGVL